MIRYLGKHAGGQGAPLPTEGNAPSPPAEIPNVLTRRSRQFQNAREFVAEPIKHGLIVFRGEGADHPGVGRTITVLGTHFSTSKQYADTFAADGDAQAFVINPTMRLFDFDVIRQELVNFQHGKAEGNQFITTIGHVTEVSTHPEVLTEKLRAECDGIVNAQPDGSVEFVFFQHDAVIALDDIALAKRAAEFVVKKEELEHRIKAAAGSDSMGEIATKSFHSAYPEEVERQLAILFRELDEAETVIATADELLSVDMTDFTPKTLEEFYAAEGGES